MRLLHAIAEPLFALAVASLLVLYPLASHLRAGDQVMAHDAHLPATEAKVAEQLEILKPINGGLMQGIAPPVLFTSAIFYGAAFALGLTPGAAQVLGMTLTFALTLWLAVSGFDRLLAGWGRPATPARKLDACLLGALYVVAPFTLIYISYGIFWSLNIALAIGIMPLLFHLFLRNFVEERDRFEWSSVAALALCLIVVAWSILFLFPTFLIFAVLLAMRGGIGKVDLKKGLALAVLPLVGSLPSLYGMYLSAFDAGWRAASDPITANAAFESIQGGVLTGFMQYAAWPIYTPWSPRLVLGFESHFSSAIYITLTTLLLLVAIAVPLVNRQFLMNQYVYVAVMLLIVVFFVKGAGQPFGAMFRGFLSSVPGAGLIRTPDTKFGVFVILALAVAVALALANGERKARWFRFLARAVIVATVAYHAIPMLNGHAILARDSELTPGQSGRGYAVALSPTERRIIDTLASEPTAGVVFLPPSFGLITRREGDMFMYRHVVSDFIPNPLYYSEWDEAPNESLKRRLQAAVAGGDWTLLPEMAVGFVLVNRNAITERAGQHALYRAIRELPGVWTRIVDEGGYELYRLVDTHRKPLVTIESDRGEAGLTVEDRGNWFVRFATAPLAPGAYTATFRSAENKHWRLVAIPRDCGRSAHVCAIRGILSAPADSVIGRHAVASELVNRWSVEKRTPAAAGGDPMMVVLVPQLLMFLFLGIALATAILCSYLLLRRERGDARRASTRGMRA
jgi:hypothetical protein